MTLYQNLMSFFLNLNRGLLAALALLLVVATPLGGCDFLLEGAPSAPDEVIVDTADDDDDDTTPPVEPAGNCADGIDNDLDGWVDGHDVECIWGDLELGVSVGECDDRLDNDFDGLIDSADPTCTVGWFPYESLPTPPGDDDDSDGICEDPMFVVFAAFACLPGSLLSLECAADSVSITCAPPAGGDTYIVTVDNSVTYQWINSFNETTTTTGDDDDSATTEPPPLPYEGDDGGECDDGADNDLDGLFDCADPGCFDSPDCADPGDDDDDSTPSGDDDDSTGCPDNDGDGYVDYACGGPDCDDWNANIHPGGVEYCGDVYDGDCSGDPDDADADLDGYISADCGGDDCLDIPGSINNQPFWLGEWVHPNQIELGDWFDSDCDGVLDNGIADVCASQYGGYELNGGADDCADGFSIADRSSTNNPMDMSVVIVYDSAMLGGTSGNYSGVTTTSEDTLPNGSFGSYDAGTGQSDPGNWWSMYDPGTPAVIDSVMELIESRN